MSTPIKKHLDTNFNSPKRLDLSEISESTKTSAKNKVLASLFVYGLFNYIGYCITSLTASALAERFNKASMLASFFV